MAERFDVTLDGQGYMLAPGSYRRQQAGVALAGGTRRVVQHRWRGALRGLAEATDRYWASVGLRPLQDGEALGPGPRERAALVVTGLDPFAKRFGVLANGQPYFVAGQALWRVESVAGSAPRLLGGCTQLGGALGVAASGLAVRDDAALFIARGGGDLWRWDIGGAAFTMYPLRFNNVAVYAGSVWGLGSATEPNRLLRVTDLATAAVDAAGWYLDSAIRTAALARDALYVGTAGALWRVKGAVSGGAFQGTIEPLVYGAGAGYGDAFSELIDFAGELYTWYGGQVMKYAVPGASGGGAANLVPTGLVAASCRGLAVAGNVLIAAVHDTPQYSGGQVWAYDGVGWWCLARNTGAGSPDYWAPLATGNFTQDADLLASSLGQNTLHGFQLRSYATLPGLAAAGEVVTSLWHGGDPDQEKVWLRVGAELVTPGQASSPGLPSFSACTVTLGYTLDGTNFTTVGSVTVDSAAARTVAFDLPTATTGKLLALKYGVSGVSDGGPSLAALWAEYRSTEPPVRKRVWSFEVLASDDVVTREGGRDSRNGSQIAAALWSAWRRGAALAFRDLDYDRDPSACTVRISTIEEQVKAPADAGRWGESRLKLGLVEV